MTVLRQRMVNDTTRAPRLAENIKKLPMLSVIPERRTHLREIQSPPGTKDRIADVY